jgi:hypothetical protein
MTIHEEIVVNQMAQGIISRQAGLDWFRSMPAEYKLSILRDLVYMASQSGFRAEDVGEACRKTDLSENFTPCVLMSRGTPKVQLAKVFNLPEQEHEKVFLLLVGLLSVGDSRRRTSKCSAGCTHWWHQNLADPNTLKQIKGG